MLPEKGRLLVEGDDIDIPSEFVAASMVPGRLFFPVSSRSSRSRESILRQCDTSERAEKSGFLMAELMD